MTSITSTNNKTSARFYYLRQNKDVVVFDNDRKTPRRTIKKHTPLALIVSTVDRSKNTVSFAVSAAHPLDGFNRKRAREIALARLVKKPFTITIPPEAKGHEINRSIMSAIVSDEQCSKFIHDLMLKSGLAIYSTRHGKEVVEFPHKVEITVHKWVSDTLSSRLRKLAREWLKSAKLSKEEVVISRKENKPQPPSSVVAPNTLATVIADTTRDTVSDTAEILKAVKVLQKSGIDTSSVTAALAKDENLFAAFIK